jgi:DNA polymerase III subunit epsilon
MTGDASVVAGRLGDRMAELAAAQRFEEAALVRDRLSALLGAVKRDRLIAALRAAGRCVVRRGDATWVVDDARLIDVTIDGTVGRSLPVDPPSPPGLGTPVRRDHVDEALCLARAFEQHAERLDVMSCTGEWRFPLAIDDRVPHLTRPEGP